jgi:hypothetical protein
MYKKLNAHPIEPNWDGADDMEYNFKDYDEMMKKGSDDRCGKCVCYKYNQKTKYKHQGR